MAQGVDGAVLVRPRTRSLSVSATMLWSPEPQRRHRLTADWYPPWGWKYRGSGGFPDWSSSRGFPEWHGGRFTRVFPDRNARRTPTGFCTGLLTSGPPEQ